MKMDSINRDRLKKLEGEKKTTLFKNSNKIPDGDNIMIFEGIMSQNFKKGEVSRNRYKYKQDWWVVDNYARLPIILWQHDDSYGGIGFAQELFIDTKWNLAGVFYVDLDMLEDRHRKQVEKGFVTAISTGAVTLEDGYEEKETGKILSFKEADEKYWFEEIVNTLFGAMNTALSYIVTKAELVENSLVTIGSNYGAIARSVNTIDDEMKRKAEDLQKQMNSQNWDTLLTNDLSMSEKDNVLEAEEATTPEVVEEVETQVDEVETEVSEGTEEETETTEEDKVEKLENELETLKNAFESYKSDMEAKLDSLKVENKKSTREEKRKTVLDNAPAIVKNGATKASVKSMDDFKNKYFNK